MPKSLDVLIGLAVIMLALGMAVTLITQFVTTVLNTRGQNLRRGQVAGQGECAPRRARLLVRRGPTCGVAQRDLQECLVLKAQRPLPTTASSPVDGVQSRSRGL